MMPAKTPKNKYEILLQFLRPATVPVPDTGLLRRSGGLTKQQYILFQTKKSTQV